MEVPPASSFSQVSALFSDTSENEQQRAFLGLFPFETPNVHLHSSDFQQSVSHSGLDKEFRTADIKEGHRILQGHLLYPYQEKAQIFNHKFDPFYFDGSELSDEFNVQENLIGTPLGASTLEDPRMTYVKNMMRMKELHGANHPLDDSYLKELFMVNAEKGSNYYQNQLDKLDASMSLYSRSGRYSKHKPLQDIQFTQNIATGAPIHEKHTASIKYESPSDAGVIQNSRRSQRMARIDDMTAPYHMVPVNMPYRHHRRGLRENTQQSGNDLSAITHPTTNGAAIRLPDGPPNTTDDDAWEDVSEDNSTYHADYSMPTLGGVNFTQTPVSRRDRNQHAQQESGTGASLSTGEQKEGELSPTSSAMQLIEQFHVLPNTEEKRQLGFASPSASLTQKISKALRLNKAEGNPLTTPVQSGTRLRPVKKLSTPNSEIMDEWGSGASPKPYGPKGSAPTRGTTFSAQGDISRTNERYGESTSATPYQMRMKGENLRHLSKKDAATISPESLAVAHAIGSGATVNIQESLGNEVTFENPDGNPLIRSTWGRAYKVSNQLGLGRHFSNAITRSRK